MGHDVDTRSRKGRVAIGGVVEKRQQLAIVEGVELIAPALNQLQFFGDDSQGPAARRALPTPPASRAPPRGTAKEEF